MCGQGVSSKGCDKYGTTTKYTGTAPSTCDIDNPTSPDLAVYYGYFAPFDFLIK
jgi:hypothetical protein